MKAVDCVADLLLKNDRHTWEIGPLGHGLHALAIYDSRVFKNARTALPSIVEESGASVPLEAKRDAAVAK
jgi:hypothetical protein